MWPFRNSAKRDAQIRSAWGGFPWIGLEGYYEHIKQKGALKSWARAVASLAEEGRTPVALSIGSDRAVAEDRSTGRTA
jgi:hypothetical protein